MVMPRAQVLRVLFQALRFRVEEVEQTDDDGTRHIKHVARHPGACVLIPLVSETEICLIENYRAAVNRTLLELPAGTLEPPEPPHETALRELAEETGYVAGQLRLIHRFFMSPGILDEAMYVYVASELQPGEASLEAGEQIQTRVCSLSEVDQLLRSGEIQDAKTIAALTYYLRYLAEPELPV
jgi:ADP-ribose pyrophosphatase